MKRLLKFDFIRFCLVGASGFSINLALLTILYRQLGLQIFIAQLISAEIALFSNFLLHHHWTYKEKNVQKTIKRLIIQFHLSSWVAIIGSAAIVSGGVRYLHLGYFVALTISSVIALGWNFVFTKYIVWRHHNEESSDE